MSKYNHWNYKELGFNSESEMNDSIKRVQRKMNMTRDELAREQKKEAFARRNDALNLTAMEEGARLERLDRTIRSRISDEKAQSKLEADRAESQKFMQALGEYTQAENEAKAQEEMQKEKEKAEKEMQKDIYSKHGVKTDEQKQHDKALSDMLKKINI